MEWATLFSLTVWLLEKIIVTEDSLLSLKAILEHTLFNTREELLAQFDDIPGKKGTRVLIWNIRRYGAGVPGEAAVPPKHGEELIAEAASGQSLAWVVSGCFHPVWPLEEQLQGFPPSPSG